VDWRATEVLADHLPIDASGLGIHAKRGLDSLHRVHRGIAVRGNSNYLVDIEKKEVKNMRKNLAQARKTTLVKNIERNTSHWARNPHRAAHIHGHGKTGGK
jgi:hypothetical protein